MKETFAEKMQRIKRENAQARAELLGIRISDVEGPQDFMEYLIDNFPCTIERVEAWCEGGTV